MRRADVCIIGGGPAGLAAAIKLRAAGLSVLVLGFDPQRHRETSDRGETLATSALRPLQALGLESEFASLDLQPITGFQSTWGSRCKQWRDAVSSRGGGWLLDRLRFESMLGNAARDAGAELFAKKALGTRDVPQPWQVIVEDSHHEMLECDFLVMASGRLGLQDSRTHPIVIDRLVGCVVSLPSSEHSDSAVRIDTAPEGWLYSIQSSNETRTLVLFTDGDLLSRSNRRSRVERIARMARSAPCIAGVVSPSVLAEATGGDVLPAATRFHAVGSGENWISCGDAAQSYDPLSSHGIAWALEDGLEAAEALAKVAAGDRDALSVRELSRHTRFVNYLRSRYYYYQSEVRWSEAPFWKRRSCDELKRTIAALQRVHQPAFAPD